MISPVFDHFSHTLLLNCRSGSKRMVACVVCEGRSRRKRNQFASARASAESKKTSSVFGIGTCADAEAPKVTSTRASDTGATVPRRFGGPEPPRKAATKISRHKLARCASPRKVSQQFAMADGFDNRCLSCSERWRDALAICPARIFARQQELKTWHSTKTPRLART